MCFIQSIARSLGLFRNTHSYNDSVIIFHRWYTPQKTSCNNDNVRNEYKTHALRKLILFRKNNNNEGRYLFQQLKIDPLKKGINKRIV